MTTVYNSVSLFAASGAGRGRGRDVEVATGGAHVVVDVQPGLSPGR